MSGKKITNRQLALKIVKTLRSNGFQAYFAGGCVRDMLLGTRPKDHDVATDAHPEQVSQLFRRTIKVGAKFGVVMVMKHQTTVEVATFRTETGYHDGRHPSKVKFASVKEDAIRRDFTINGLYYDPLVDKVLDFVDGQADIKKRTIRAIGNPDKRFSEDYLRMLRAIRFSSRFDFKIEPQTWRAIANNAHKIKNISRERISVELEGILTHPNRVVGTKFFIDSGLAEIVFEKFNAASEKQLITLLSHLPKDVDYALALAAFWLFSPVKTAMHNVHTLRLSRNQIAHIHFLFENLDGLDDAEIPLAELKLLVAQPYFEDLFSLKKALLKTENQPLTTLRKIRKRVNALAGKQLKPKPLLNGHDLIALGVQPGPMVGHLSRELYIAQLSEHIETVSQARKWVDNWLKKHN